MLLVQQQEIAVKTNTGTIDRATRIVIGLGLVVAAYAGFLGPWAWIGIVPLATGVVGVCPIYRLLGIDTCGLGRN